MANVKKLTDASKREKTMMHRKIKLNCNIVDIKFVCP